MQCFLIFTL